MGSTKRLGWSVLVLMSAAAAGVLQSGGCLSMTDSVSNESGVLIADSLAGTWLMSVDTANLAPFELVLSLASDGSHSTVLSGFSRIPEFASRMGLNLIRSNALAVTLTPPGLVIRGLAVGNRPLMFIGGKCGCDLCGAMLTDSLPEVFLDKVHASR